MFNTPPPGPPPLPPGGTPTTQSPAKGAAPPPPSSAPPAPAAPYTIPVYPGHYPATAASPHPSYVTPPPMLPYTAAVPPPVPGVPGALPYIVPPGYQAAPPGYPPQYLHYPGHYPPHYQYPAGVAPHYSYPPPAGASQQSSHHRDRDRSPHRGDRRDRYDDRDYRDRRHRHRRSRSRDRDERQRHRSSRRHSPGRDRERRHSPGRDRDRRHREDRDRAEKARLRREKEKKENMPSAYKPKPLVPYGSESDEEEKRVGDERSKKDNRSESPKDIKDFTKLTPEEIIEQEKKVWIRSAPADLYYERDRENPNIMRATQKSQSLLSKFEKKLITASVEEREKNPIEPAPRPRVHVHHHHHGDDDDSDGEEEDPGHNHKVESMEWMNTRSKANNRAHSEVWFNVAGELNDGPACRCSKAAKEAGIRHGIYVGESPLPALDPHTNNFDKLYHYRVTISPPTNFLIKHPTIINHDQHEFIFEGFSMLTVDKIPEVPVCKVLRFNIEYNILYFEEKMPENFTLAELTAFNKYFFHELCELWDWSVDGRYFFMPRFVRDLSENGKEILSMNEVISYMLTSYTPLIEEMDLMPMTQMSQAEWQMIADRVKGMLVTYPGRRPSTLRVDQLDREQDQASGTIKYPDIVHFGVRPPQLSYAGSQDYQKAWREFVKFRHLLANMAKPSYKEKRELEDKEHALQEMRSNSKLKRDCTAVISAQGYYKTGLMTDIVQHALLLPVLINHLRLHNSLDHLEKRISYTFTNRHLLQQAVTHPSYKENFGTNPDHIRNTLSNCGIRQPEYGDKKIHYQNSRKRGINTLISIMSMFGKKRETESKVQHNERLEFLGDAVVEFITSVHLYYMFPDLEEGGLATYRAAMVQNQHLAILAAGLGLDKYMLYAHGSDLCHDSELRHAMANCFEALMGAIFLDGGINLADTVFAEAMFGSENDLWETWKDLSPHPLQTQEPNGDRHWIETYPVLKKLVEFEAMTGLEFKHIRLLARAFTDRSIGFNNLTLGSNQRMEFLGDTVLQLITSEYLYKHFPDHHEGHLSLLRSSLVNNRTQSVVCDDLGMIKFALYANPKAEIKVKDKADLLEALLGALYVDKDLTYCQVFANVCFFPRLHEFILNQDWNDPKSKLQQCCLTLRTMDGGEPDIPIYKIIECKGPTNTRVYTVAVYFRGDRLAKAHGHSIQQAEMNAAKLALEKKSDLFPHLNYQKRIMEKSFKRQGVMSETIRETWYKETLKKRKELGLDPPDGASIKQEIKVEVKREEVELSSDNQGSNDHSDVQLQQPPQPPHPHQPEQELEHRPRQDPDKDKELNESTNKESGEKVNPPPRDRDKEAVRAEIKEIEEKLKKKREDKAAKVAAAEEDLEDGECIDSDDDEEEQVQNIKAGESSSSKASSVASQDPSTHDKAKQREDNRRRWSDDRKERDRYSRDRDSRQENRHRDGRRSHERYYYDQYRS